MEALTELCCNLLKYGISLATRKTVIRVFAVITEQQDHIGRSQFLHAVYVSLAFKKMSKEEIHHIPKNP